MLEWAISIIEDQELVSSIDARTALQRYPQLDLDPRLAPN